MPQQRHSKDFSSPAAGTGFASGVAPAPACSEGSPDIDFLNGVNQSDAESYGDGNDGDVQGFDWGDAIPYQARPKPAIRVTNHKVNHPPPKADPPPPPPKTKAAAKPPATSKPPDTTWKPIAGLLLAHGKPFFDMAAQAGIGVDSFKDQTVRVLWQTAKSMLAQGAPLDAPRLVERAGMPVAIAEGLIDNAPILAHAEYYVSKVIEGTAAEKLRGLLKKTLRQMEDPACTPDYVKAGLVRKLNTVNPPASVQVIDGARLLSEDPPPHDAVVPGLFDRHALVEIVGPPKVRKSFFAMQWALKLAGGIGGFGFNGTEPRRVMIADMELPEDELHRRCWQMAKALGITAASIGDRLTLITLAGQDNLQDTIEAAGRGSDVLIVDPLYALCDGAEVIENMRDPLRWLRRLATERDAVVFVHHDAKGSAGDRNTRDRGSGSNITGRAVDARITLTPAAADPDSSVVVAFMTRSYVAPPPGAWTFHDGAFLSSDIPAEAEKTSNQRTRAARPKLAEYEASALKILTDAGPMQPRLFKSRIRESLNLSKHATDDLVATLTSDGGQVVKWNTTGFPTQYFIGLLSQREASGKPAGEPAGNQRETSGKPEQSPSAVPAFPPPLIGGDADQTREAQPDQRITNT